MSGEFIDLQELVQVLSQQEVTGLLMAWVRGDRAAMDQLVPRVHAELRRLAHRHMLGERRDHTLQTTALVNEAYLKLVDCQRVNWQNRAHFLALSAQLMRRILVGYARSRGYKKRGGGSQRVSFDEGMVVARQRSSDWMALDEALTELAKVDERKSRVVELRYFGGLSWSGREKSVPASWSEPAAETTSCGGRSRRCSRRKVERNRSLKARPSRPPRGTSLNIVDKP